MTFTRNFSGYKLLVVIKSIKVVYLFGVCTLVGMEHMHRQHETEFNEQIAGNIDIRKPWIIK